MLVFVIGDNLLTLNGMRSSSPLYCRHAAVVGLVHVIEKAN